MSAEPSVITLTADEFYELPDPPEGGKMELVCGTVVSHRPVGGEHGTVAIQIAARLLAFAEAHRLGDVGAEVGFRLFEVPDPVRAPDAHFVSADRLIDGRMPRSYYSGCPDLAVEVVSPEDTDNDVNTKVLEYLSAGTRHVWVVRPETKTVTVHTPDGLARTLNEAVSLRSSDAGFDVEGFELPISRIFD